MNHLLADDSREIPCLIFLKIKKDDTKKVVSASVVIGALRVKINNKRDDCIRLKDTDQTVSEPGM